jgi:hypothetical protein
MSAFDAASGKCAGLAVAAGCAGDGPKCAI